MRAQRPSSCSRRGLFAGIKDSSGIWDDFLLLKAAREKQKFALLIGNDAIYTQAREAGADGVVSGCACAVPELLLAIDHAIRAGNGDAAARLDARLKEFIAWIERFPAPVGVREAVALRGIKTGPHAIPLGPEGQARCAGVPRVVPRVAARCDTRSAGMLRRSVLRGGVLALAGRLEAQLYVPGPQVTTFLSDVDDSDQPYGLYLPRKLDGAKKYPLVISLHGADSNHRLNLRRVFGRGIRPGQSESEASREFPRAARG